MKTPSRYTIISCILVAVTFLAIFTLDRLGLAGEEEFDPTQETTQVPYTLYANEERGLSFDIPEGWELEVKTDTEEQFLLNLKSTAFDPDTTDNVEVLNYTNLNLYIWDTKESQTPVGFRDFVINLLKENSYNLVEKGQSNLGSEEAVYVLMQDPPSITTHYYTVFAKYIISARDTRAFYMSLVYNDTIGIEKEQEYLSILEHMSESFVWNEP